MNDEFELVLKEEKLTINEAKEFEKAFIEVTGVSSTIFKRTAEHRVHNKTLIWQSEKYRLECGIANKLYSLYDNPNIEKPTKRSKSKRKTVKKTPKTEYVLKIRK